jgi:helix-turn-helix protein
MRPKEREIQRRLRVLEHAMQIGNTRMTCRHFGLSRSTFYRWKKEYDKKPALLTNISGDFHLQGDDFSGPGSGSLRRTPPGIVPGFEYFYIGKKVKGKILLVLHIEPAADGSVMARQGSRQLATIGPMGQNSRYQCTCRSGSRV